MPAAVYIDPLVAIGYDYQVGAGDPLFTSVTLPTGIGDNKYQLFLNNGTGFVFAADLDGGVTYNFAGGGVDLFRILGIELSAGLDPNNATAFITALTFAGDGTFSGTMTPLTAVATPLPATLPLFATGLGLIGILTRRNRRRKE